MKKRLLLLLLAVTMLLNLTSCIEHYELKEIAIVQAIGVDYEEENFKLTLQIYSPQGPGGNTAIDTSKNNSTIIKAQGRTVAEAVENASMTQGNSIFTGHNRILVLGHSFAENGIQEIFSYFNRSALTRQNAKVLLAEKTAEEIVSTDLIQGILAAETIEKIVNNASQNGLIYDTVYYRLSKNMNLYNGCEVIPIISATPQEESKSSSGDSSGGEPEKGGSSGEGNSGGSQPSTIQNVGQLKIDKTGIFKDYKLMDELDHTQSRGLLLLSGQMDECTLAVKDPKLKRVSVKLYDCDSALKANVESGKLSYTLTVQAKASLDEVLQPQQVELTEEELLRLEEECQTLLTENAKSCFTSIANKNQSDVIYLSELARRADDSFLESSNVDFDTLLKEASLTVNCTVDIERLGMETDEKIP